MLAAFYYRYSKILLRNPTDTAAMLVRPLLSGVLLLIFAQSISGADSLPGFLIASVMVSNIITNTVLGAAYEARMDLEDGKRELIELAPGGLRSYGIVQALTQGGIATVQSVLVGALLLPWTNTVMTFTPVFWAASAILAVTLIAVAAFTAQRSAIRQSYVGVSFTLGIVLTFSGIFYPLDALPTWARLISAVNPVTYLVQGIRAPFNAADSSQLLGLGYACIWALLAVLALFWPARHPT